MFWRSPERVCGLMERADAIRPAFEPPLAQVRLNERRRQMPPSHGKYHSCSGSDGRDRWEMTVFIRNPSRIKRVCSGGLERSGADARLGEHLNQLRGTISSPSCPSKHTWLHSSVEHKRSTFVRLMLFGSKHSTKCLLLQKKVSHPGLEQHEMMTE